MTFPILIEVEDSALGSVLKLLNGYPGIAKLHLDLDAVGGPKGTRKGVPQGPRKQRQPGEPSSNDITIAFLVKNGPQKSGVIGDELAKHGFSKTSAPSVLTALKEKHIVHGIGAAFWDLTDEAKARMGAIPALPAPSPPNAKTAHDVVLDKMKSQGGTAKRLELAQALSENNLSASSISRVMSDLKKRGAIVADDEPGTYRIAPKSNGAAPPAKSAKKSAKHGSQRTSRQPDILKFMKRRKKSVSTDEIATAIGATKGAVDGALFRMRRDTLVETVSPGMFQLVKSNAAEEPSTAPQE